MQSSWPTECWSDRAPTQTMIWQCSHGNSFVRRELRELYAELREAAFDYASLIQVENFDRNDIAVHRAYERLRKTLDDPFGLRPKPRLVVNT